MAVRERLLVLDLLESYVRERDAAVEIECRDGRHWFCRLRPAAADATVHGSGHSARAAIRSALERAGVHLPT